jgi:hypothetical protein
MTEDRRQMTEDRRRMADGWKQPVVIQKLLQVLHRGVREKPPWLPEVLWQGHLGVGAAHGAWWGDPLIKGVHDEKYKN